MIDFDQLDNSDEFCRVCRCEPTYGRPLFHPCKCTGTMKHVHQECLLKWLNFCKRESCEVCKFKFQFDPIYSAQMPKILPFKEIFQCLLNHFVKFVNSFLYVMFVAFCWLIVVPFLSYKIIYCMFKLSFNSLQTILVDLFDLEKLLSGQAYGFGYLFITFVGIIILIWLREKIIKEKPVWLFVDETPSNQFAVQEALREINDEDQDNDEDSSDLDEQQRQDNLNRNDGQDDDWEIADEEVNFTRMFGFDGTLSFIQHVFWFTFLNIFFIFAFIFLPYYVGIIFLEISKIIPIDTNKRIDNIIAALFGYGISVFFLQLIYQFKKKSRKIRYRFGVVFLILKIIFFFVYEVVLLPIICGWTIDISSMKLFNATLADRQEFFKVNPEISITLHWFIGVLYLLGIASILYLLKGVVKPSFFLFNDSLDDIDEDPVKKIIHTPIFDIIKKFFHCFLVFNFLILLLVYIPSNIIQMFFYNILPYDIKSDAHLMIFSVKIWKLQLISFLLFDHTNIKTAGKFLTKKLCYFTANFFNLNAFFFEEDNTELDDESNFSDDSEKTEIIEDYIDEETLKYLKKKSDRFDKDMLKKKMVFIAKMICLSIYTCILLVILGLFSLTFPILLGRGTLKLFFTQTSVNELYSLTTGFFMIFLTNKLIDLALKWIPRGKNVIFSRVKEIITLSFNYTSVFLLVFGYMPFLIGLVHYTMLIIPLKVSFDKTPIYYYVQVWLIGLLIVNSILFNHLLFNLRKFQQWIEDLCTNGPTPFDINEIINDYTIPLTSLSGLVLSLPYIFFYGIMPYCGLKLEDSVNYLKYAYFLIYLIGTSFLILTKTMNGFKATCDNVKHEKYLIGLKLVNYYPVNNINRQNQNS